MSGTFCRNGPEGASHKRYLTPFFPESRKAIESVLPLNRACGSVALSEEAGKRRGLAGCAKQNNC